LFYRRQFDLVVQKGHAEQGVWIRDWNRTIGVNIIIGLDTASEDVGLLWRVCLLVATANWCGGLASWCVAFVPFGE
jgi:hypothetical protein